MAYVDPISCNAFQKSGEICLKTLDRGHCKCSKLPSRQNLFSEVLLNDSRLYSFTWRDYTSKAYFQYLPAVKYVYKIEVFITVF